MAKYKKDQNRVLSESTRFVIPLNTGETEDDGTESITCVRVLFNAGDSYQFIKQELRATLKALGVNRATAQRYIRTAFPEVFSG